MARLTPIVLVVLLAGCSQQVSPGAPAHARGPAHVEVAEVFLQAHELARNFSPRPAGSQKESLAAAYLLAHVAKLGYAVRLDSVPVAHAVSSANVVAFPRAGAPKVVVATAYDGGSSTSSVPLGLWLELARVAAVRDVPVGFVALGADHTSIPPGQLGSRRLAAMLLDEHLHPLVVSLDRVEAARWVAASGPGASRLHHAASRHGFGWRPNAIVGPTIDHPDVFAEAGFHHLVVAGGAGPLGVVLDDVFPKRQPSRS